MAISKALVKHIEAHTLLGRAASHHWVPLDSSIEGAPTAANDPVQLLLIACAGCVMMDVVDILHKQREVFDRVEIEIEAVRRDAPPRVVQRLDYHVRLSGSQLHEETVFRAAELSLTRYCSVSLSLDRSVKFFVEITINGRVSESREVPRNPDWFED